MYSALPLSQCDFVAVDLEATGPVPGRNSILEIGAARMRGGVIIDTLESLTRPTESVPPAVEHLTGITAAVLAGAPALDPVMTRFREFAAGAVLVAHNYRFDLGYLDHESERLWGTPWERPVLDTLTLARRLHPGLPRYNLGALAHHFGVEAVPNHRALPDAVAAAQILAAMLPDLERIGVTTVGALASFCGMDRQTLLASRLRLTAAVSDDPGVFLFRDEDGRVLFVGRAKNLRSRTRSYFYPAPGEPNGDIGASVTSLTAYRALSPLDAALLERRLLDRYDPPANAPAQRPHPSYLIHADASPIPGLRVVTSPRSRGVHAGPFTSRWAAQTLADRLSEAYGLRRCPRRLGPRLASSACEYRGAGCPSPCVRPVDRIAYRERLAEVFQLLTGDGIPIRSTFDRLQQAAAESHRYEDAIRFRDGVKALDRALGTLKQVRDAADMDVVAVEEHDSCMIVHLIRGGRRVAVVRGPRRRVLPRVLRALDRVYFSGATRTELAALRGPDIAHMILVSNFLANGEHAEVPVTDRDVTIEGVRRALGVSARAPRRRHAVV